MTLLQLKVPVAAIISNEQKQQWLSGSVYTAGVWEQQLDLQIST